MHTRILFGVAAWVLGAGAATAGSLLAVSLLGQGITGGSGQLVSQDAVNRALASEATEASPSPSPVVTAIAPAMTVSGPPSPTRAATPSPVTSATAPPPAPATTTAAPSPAPTSGTVLTSPGGTVVAACPATGAYLVSWSPLQGYEVGDVARGPAATARVTFESISSHVTMVVSCSAGVPSATSSTRSGGDN